jgi:alkyl hydroperoxide reductase subunit F
MYDLIIIGGGPAGMTAAVYAARKKLNTLLMCKDIGGQVVTTSWVENYMGYQYVEGIELMDKFEQQMKQFPIERKSGEEITNISRSNGNFQITSQSSETYQSKVVIVATGKKSRKLNVPGEERLLSRGVSYCSVCDGPLFAGEKIAVIGGGNSALEAIDDLIKVSEAVYSITEANYTGDSVIVERISDNPRLKVFHGYKVIEIQGSDRVEGIVIQGVKNRDIETLFVRGVFIEVGLIPNSDLVKDILKLNSNAEIEVNCNCETGVPGLFAAGDVTNTPEKQIIIAAGEGAKAALQANRYLQRLSA